MWFKADLRVHDHPGLHDLFSMPPSNVSSSDARPRTRALFVMDPDVYKSVVDTRAAAEALASAVASLGVALGRLGVPLEVRCGRWADVVPEVVRESSATKVVCERECSGAFAQGMARVTAELSADDVEVEAWDCLLFHGYDEDMEAFPVWKRMRVHADQAARPLDTPAIQPGSVDAGQPSQPTPVLTGEEIWSVIEESRKDTTVHTDEASAVALFAASSEGHAWDCLEAYLGHDAAPTSVPDMLSAALMSYDGDDQTIDGCYPAVFNRALYATGVLSRRHVHAEALRYLIENGDTAPYDEAPLFRGPLSWLGWMLTSSGGAHVREKRFRRAKAALNGVIQQDFHLGHSYRRDGMRHSFGATTRHWRWRGVLTDYLAVEGDDAADGARKRGDKRPAIVLVHGFGAFGEHWRRNVRELADLGYDVYAPTFPGYGRSEKMSMQYGQDLWRDFLADFISEIVGRPVVIAGNSIGGYISASVAADFPQLIKGLVLLNSAGQIDEGFQPRQYEIDLLESPRQPPPVVVVDAISTLLFSFLEGDIENQLQRLYPTRPDNADEWLGKEIRRASEDPKALGVFRSVFFLPSPRPLNHLINDLYRGKVMVLQGVLDPLNDATKRAAQIVGACPQAELITLQAGHCPHDEVPEIVNRELGRFAAQCFSTD